MRSLLTALFLTAALASCSGPVGDLVSEAFPPQTFAEPSPFMPPTLSVPTPQKVTPTPVIPTEDPRPSPTPPCQPGLRFLEDITVPDGSVVAPGEQLDKRWHVENSGTCNWDQDNRVRQIAGPDLGAPAEQMLFPARSGTRTVIRMIVTAPSEPGAYRSAWQAHTLDGSPFGDPFFIEVLVAETAP